MRILFLLLFVLPGLGTTAQNLVPNPSFEDYSQCPNGLWDFVGYVNDWFEATPGSADYYNGCAPIGSFAGVPYNSSGFQQARSGSAYAGIITYGDSGAREYVETRLSSPLESDSIYCVEFFVSRSNLLMASIWRIGAYFTTDSLFYPTFFIHNVFPQISNPTDSFLNDTLGWTRISGTFVAQGGEQFITIGNFYPNSQTPVIGNTQPLPANYAYYYIDDVTVSKCSTFGLSINALVGKEKQLLNAFPNPSTGSLTIDYAYDPGKVYRISVSDLAGRIVYNGTVSAGARMITLSHLTDGAYLVQLSKNDRVVGHSKLILLK